MLIEPPLGTNQTRPAIRSWSERRVCRITGRRAQKARRRSSKIILLFRHEDRSHLALGTALPLAREGSALDSVAALLSTWWCSSLQVPTLRSVPAYAHFKSWLCQNVLPSSGTEIQLSLPYRPALLQEAMDDQYRPRVTLPRSFHPWTSASRRPSARSARTASTTQRPH